MVEKEDLFDHLGIAASDTPRIVGSARGPPRYPNAPQNVRAVRYLWIRGGSARLGAGGVGRGGHMQKDGAAAVLARKQYGLISAAQAEGLGFTRKMIKLRLKRRLWRRILRGVYAVGAAVESWHFRAQAALLATGPGASLCRRSAAFQLGWTLKPPKTIEVLVPHRRKLCAPGPGVVVARARALEEEQTKEVRGLRTTTAPRTLIDLAGEADIEDMLDGAIYAAPNNLLWTKDCVRRGDGVHRSGIRKLRQLLSERSPEASTPDSRDEARFRQMLKKAGIPAVHHQVLFDANDEFIMESDFSWPRHKVIAELDGGRYHHSRSSARRRADAQQRLAAIHWRLIPVTRADMKERPAELLARIKLALEAG